MKKAVKAGLITAAVLVVIGALIFVLTAYSVGWNFNKLGEGRYETKTYEVKEEFSNVSLKTDTADIAFVPSDDGNCKVVCDEEKNKKYSVAATDGVLTVEVVDTRKWYERTSWFSSENITVYLPRTEYASLVVEGSTGAVEIPEKFSFDNVDVTVSTGSVKCFARATGSVKITASTGDVYVENVSAGLLDLTVSTGKITASGVTCDGDVKIAVSTGKTVASDIRCENFISTGSTGDISLKSVIAAQKFTIQRSTGGVKFEGCDAAGIYVKTSTGDVIGSLLSEKVFITNTNTGETDVPKTSGGGRCEITTSTGDIKIQIG
ncbi:MAG: DUF4097 family beta strand repeat-containing protein [Candidatus Scatosoma sp.]